LANHRPSRWREALAESLGMPKDILLNLSRIVVIGDHQLFIENHQGITEFTPQRVRVQASPRAITITGDNLALRNISGEEIALEGKILTIALGDLR